MTAPERDPMTLEGVMEPIAMGAAVCTVLRLPPEAGAARRATGHTADRAARTPGRAAGRRRA